ncbi:hypothetical protein GCM10027019_31170 [Melaminivora jejuensis]
MQHIEQIEQRIARMDQYLLQGLRPWQPQLRLLQTLPGIDEQGAAMLLVEIGADMSVFGSAERLASWVGICPGNNESAGKRKTGRIRKGNAWVRRLPCEFAQAAARTRCALKAKFDALTIRKGHKKSVVALAHKMLRTIYAMLSNGSHYQDKEVDYEALNVQRNAPRWIKMLRKHGFIATPAAASDSISPLTLRPWPASGQVSARTVAGVFHINRSHESNMVRELGGQQKSHLSVAFFLLNQQLRKFFWRRGRDFPPRASKSLILNGIKHLRGMMW